MYIIYICMYCVYIYLCIHQHMYIKCTYVHTLQLRKDCNDFVIIHVHRVHNIMLKSCRNEINI